MYVSHEILVDWLSFFFWASVSSHRQVYPLKGCAAVLSWHYMDTPIPLCVLRRKTAIDSPANSCHSVYIVHREGISVYISTIMVCCSIEDSGLAVQAQQSKVEFLTTIDVFTMATSSSSVPEQYVRINLWKGIQSLCGLPLPTACIQWILSCWFRF